MTTQAITVVDHETVTRDYDFRGNIAIIEHPKHGRLLLQDGFGGIDTLAGGAVRWRHGVLNKLQPGDTIESLKETESEFFGVSQLEAATRGEDGSRPLLLWEGHALEMLAEQAGL